MTAPTGTRRRLADAQLWETAAIEAARAQDEAEHHAGELEAERDALIETLAAADEDRDRVQAEVERLQAPMSPPSRREHVTASQHPAVDAAAKPPNDRYVELVREIYRDPRADHPARELLLAVAFALIPGADDPRTTLRIAAALLGRDTLGQPRYPRMIAADAPRYEPPNTLPDQGWCEAPPPSPLRVSAAYALHSPGLRRPHTAAPASADRPARLPRVPAASRPPEPGHGLRSTKPPHRRREGPDHRLGHRAPVLRPTPRPCRTGRRPGRRTESRGSRAGTQHRWPPRLLFQGRLGHRLSAPQPRMDPSDIRDPGGRLAHTGASRCPGAWSAPGRGGRIEQGPMTRSGFEPMREGGSDV